MKRVTAILTYEKSYDKDEYPYYKLLNLSVVTRDNRLVTLRQNKYGMDDDSSFTYYSWHVLCEYVLNLLRVNGYYLSSYENFGRRWYDIQFIDASQPWEIKRFSHSWH